MSETRIFSQNIREAAKSLRAGDRVLLTGTVYTARDAAHQRIAAALKNGDQPPFPLNDAIIYYTGPTPAKNGLAVGSAGPTTSGRMDIYTPLLLENGLCAMIGKGERCESVTESMIKNRAVYLCALGGAGALYSRHIESCKIIAYEDLGCESIKRLYVKDMPLITAIDSSGGNIFNSQR